jgi:5-methylcytosine-specific restriction endonuclease McrA
VSQPGRCAKHDAGRAYDRAYRAARRDVIARAKVCAICGGPPRTDDPLTADHMVPVARGGGRNQANLRAVHRSCNSRKGSAYF